MRGQQTAEHADGSLEDGHGGVGVERQRVAHIARGEDEFGPVAEEHEGVEGVDERDGEAVEGVRAGAGERAELVEGQRVVLVRVVRVVDGGRGATLQRGCGGRAGVVGWRRVGAQQQQHGEEQHCCPVACTHVMESDGGEVEERQVVTQFGSSGSVAW